jgi:hypothetical protein
MKIPAHVSPLLERSANFAIEFALNAHLPQFNKKASSEPECVAAFVLFSLPKIARDWSKLLSPHGIALSVSGVFCHQSPMVRFDTLGRVWPPAGRPKRCELADLLIVHDNKVNGKIAHRRAVLIQAKKTVSGIVSAPDPVQYHLYNQLPLFEIETRTFMSGPRDFTQAMASQFAWSGMQYGLIRDTAGSLSTWHMHDPLSPLTCLPNQQLSRFLTDMLVNSSPAGRAAVPGGSDDWDRTIDELLAVTTARTFRLKWFLPSGSARAGALHLGVLAAGGTFYEFGADRLPSAMSDFMGVSGGDRPPRGEEPDRPGPGAGVSTVLFETDRED